MNRIYLLIGLLLQCFVLVKAQNPIVLSSKQESVEVQNIAYYIDEQKKFSFRDIKGHDSFVISEEKIVNVGFSKAALWTKFQLTQKEDSIQMWILECNSAAMDSVQLFIVQEGGSWEEKQAGFMMPFRVREMVGVYPSFSVKILRNQIVTIYIRCTNTNTLLLGATLKQEKNYFTDALLRDLAHGFYFGLMLAMILYNLFIFFSLKDVNYLFYVLNILAPSILFFTSSGYFLKYIAPESPILNYWVLRISFPFIVLTTGIFAKRFMEASKYAPIWNHVLTATMSFSVLAFIGYSFTQTAKLSNLAITIHSPLLLISGIAVWRAGNKAARFYVFAWFFYVAFGLTITLRNMGLIPATFIAYHGVKIGSAIEVILLALALSDRYSIYRREKEAISKRLLSTQRRANEELERKVAERTAELRETVEELNQTNEELNATVRLLDGHKKAIEIKNKNIIASIQYAKRIQDAMLLPTEAVRKILPSSFVFFKPRDIVSGDFYFITQKGKEIIVVVADCTGHGVPGAFMSMLGHELLEQIVNAHHITTPHLILQKMHEGIHRTLKQDESDSRDGMDLSICVLKPEEKIALYAGAMNPIYYIQNNTFSEIKGDKVPIGGYYRKIPFPTYTTHTIPLTQETVFYLCSDGFQDQFGGEEGKKFKVKRLKELLFEIHTFPLEQQESILAQTLYDWKGTEQRQIDDILIVGFRFSLV